jgi:hypothetical protein
MKRKQSLLPPFVNKWESSERKIQETIRLQTVEKQKFEELTNQNQLKKIELEQQKYFIETLQILIEQNKQSIEKINLFMDRLAKKQNTDPVNDGIMLMLTFLQTIQMPIMVEIVKHMGASFNKDEYIKLLSYFDI